MVTTILVMLLVCVLVTIMLTLSLYSQSLSKTQERLITRQNRLDMLTDLFLEYNNVPSETFGYTIHVYYFEDGSSTMTVRSKPTSILCDMVVEQRDGELIARYYDIPYTHTETVSHRTIGIHNETDTNPHLKLTIPKSAVSANGPFYVYGKIKLERAMGIGSDRVRVYVNLAGDGKAERTLMTLNANSNGWVDLKEANGSALKFENVPSSSLQFLFGMDKTSGELSISDLVVVNSQGKVCYSLSNDACLNGAGDVRAVLSGNNRWSRHSFYAHTTTAPIVTRDPDNYVAKRALSVTQAGYRCHGEPSVVLYKSALRDAPNGGEGHYYITGRIRVTITGRAELCDKAGDSPTGMLLDVHGYYDHDNNTSTPDIISTYPAGSLQGDSVFFVNSGCWTPLLNQNGEYYKFYVPYNCERSGEDYIKFTLWAAMGSFDVADIRVYKLTDKNATPNPASDTLVYNMETDTSLPNYSYPNCALGGETKINDYWSIHWFSYQKNANYADKLDYTQAPGSFTVEAIVNPNSVSHNKATDYDLPAFPNKVGSTYTPY